MRQSSLTTIESILTRCRSSRNSRSSLLIRVNLRFNFFANHPRRPHCNPPSRRHLPTRLIRGLITPPTSSRHRPAARASYRRATARPAPVDRRRRRSPRPSGCRRCRSPAARHRSSRGDGDGHRPRDAAPRLGGAGTLRRAGAGLTRQHRAERSRRAERAARGDGLCNLR